MTKYIAYIVELLRIINDYELVIISACLIYYIIISISLYFIYLRIDKKKINALIPVVNIISLLDLVSLPKLLIILVFIPYINFIGVFIVSILINYRLGKALKQGRLMRLGLVLCPIIFMPIVATKNLEYKKLPPSPMLKEEEEIEEEEEFVLDIKYNVQDIDVGLAYDVSQYINEEMYKEVKKTAKQETVNNEVADLTFDYNDLYNNNKDKKDENEEKEDMNNQDINSQIPQMPGTVNNNINNQGVAVMQPQAYAAYNGQAPAAMPQVQPQMQQYAAPQVQVQTQQLPGAVAPVQTTQVSPGVSTPNGPTAMDVAQPVSQPAVEPYNPSQSLANYTQDYNSIYNIQPQTYEEIKPVVNTPVKTNEFNPVVDSLVATGVPFDDEKSINTLQMAAPPSFEEVKTEVEEPQAAPIIYTPVPENLVSINIVEPDALPVGIPVKPVIEQPIEYSDMLSSTPLNSSNFDLLATAGNNLNNNFSNSNEVVQLNNFDNNQGGNNMSSASISNIFVNDAEPFNPNQQFNNNVQSQNSSRFIQEEKKLDFERRDYNNTQQTTLDPVLMSDPMAIFGSSTGLRPTSNESLREPKITPGGNDVCPNCGFLVKPGQPSCVVCGFRFQ